MQKIPGMEEEKEMGEEDLAAKMHMLRQREQEQEKMGNAVEGLKQKMEDVYEQQKKIVDGFNQQKDTKPDEKSQSELVNGVKNLTNMICDPVTGKCVVVTKDEFKKLEEKIPKILGGHQDMSSLFRHLDEGKDPNLDEAVQGRIPASLKVKWVKEWCKDGECKPLLQKEGITVHDDEEPPRKGAYPGSVR